MLPLNQLHDTIDNHTGPNRTVPVCTGTYPYRVQSTGIPVRGQVNHRIYRAAELRSDGLNFFTGTGIHTRLTFT